MKVPTLDKDFNLTLNLGDIIDHLPPEDRATILKSVGFDRWLIQAIVDSLASGFTEDGWWFDDAYMTALREKLVPLMPAVTQELVRDLIQQRDQAKADEERHSKWAWSMYHTWRDTPAPPPIPAFVYIPKEPA